MGKTGGESALCVREAVGNEEASFKGLESYPSTVLCPALGSSVHKDMSRSRGGPQKWSEDWRPFLWREAERVVQPGETLKKTLLRPFNA